MKKTIAWKLFSSVMIRSEDFFHQVILMLLSIHSIPLIHGMNFLFSRDLLARLYLSCDGCEPFHNPQEYNNPWSHRTNLRGASMDSIWIGLIPLVNETCAPVVNHHQPWNPMKMTHGSCCLVAPRYSVWWKPLKVERRRSRRVESLRGVALFRHDAAVKEMALLKKSEKIGTILIIPGDFAGNAAWLVVWNTLYFPIYWE